MQSRPPSSSHSPTHCTPAHIAVLHVNLSHRLFASHILMNNLPEPPLSCRHTAFTIGKLIPYWREPHRKCNAASHTEQQQPHCCCHCFSWLPVKPISIQPWQDTPQHILQVSSKHELYFKAGSCNVRQFI